MNSSLPAAISRECSGYLRRATCFFGLLLLAALMVSCKKPAFPSSDAATSNADSSTAASRSSTSTGGATPGGGGVSSNAADQPGSLADRLKAVEDGPLEDKPTPVVLPDWKPVSSATSSIVIPMVVGLVIDGVISDKYGDHETIRLVQEISPQSINFKLTGDILQKPSGGAPVTSKRATGYRIVDTADLANGHRLMHFFEANKTEHYPGSVALSASAEILSQLHAGQPSQYDFQNDVTNMLSEQLSGHESLSESLISWDGHYMYKCDLKRVEATDLSFPVLVNDVRVELPAVHAICIVGKDEQAHFYFLDQPSNPILLATQIGAFDARSQMIKINWTTSELKGAGGTSSMETTLAQKKPVQIYGIYFDFNSAAMKPESEAVLKQISDILQKNPDWKLNVSGHTDNVGDTAFNLGLSQRRAAAVKDALVTRYKIAPDHLATSGYGASMPIEPNTTFEGRARNRRVELQRQ
jgi:outer membrane protein OmpA-like peptidoglycan-associated protein